MPGEFKALHLVRPSLPFLPEVESPNRNVRLSEKLVYTFRPRPEISGPEASLQLPLYGIHSTTGADPFYWMRVIMASSRGTVMELGMSPIVTSGMVMQLLVGSKMIKVDNSFREDRALLNGAQKLLGILIAVGQAVCYVLSGMYGPVGQLGVGNAILIISQLCFASIIVMCLDELLQKGYGLGSGISLFIATNICLDLSYCHLLPRLSCGIISGIKVTSQDLRGSFLVNLLGKWKESGYSSGQLIPVGGLAYYITPPSSLASMAADPFHDLFYLVFMLAACALLSKAWIQVSGSSARDVAKQLKVFLVLPILSMGQRGNLAVSKVKNECGTCHTADAECELCVLDF
ncbi:hypothetical protein ACLB2K_028063 [Fragaria x ananassa]